MSTAEHTQDWRDRKKQQGLCPQCGKNPSRNGKRCTGCLFDSTEYNRQRFQNRYDAGLCVECGKNPHEKDKKSCSFCLQKRREKYKNSDNKEARRQQAAEIRWARKKRVLEHYGGKCMCCEEAEPIFLAMDHIYGGGNEHRREIGNNPGSRGGSSSVQFYKWIEKNNYPDILQILCHNCNMGKHLNGGICPHKDHTRSPFGELDYNPVPPNKTFTQKTRYIHEGEDEPLPDNSNL